MLLRGSYALTVFTFHAPEDQEWLDAVNAERHAEQMSKVSPEAFEIIMDRLEKEWYELVRLSRSICVDGSL